MGQLGTSKVFRFVLVDVNPAPVTNADETWTLKLLDASGAPVTDATFPVLRPWMPMHGHGTGTTIGVTNNHDGTYTLSNMYFFMLGLWQTDITAQSGSQSDSTTFSFCLQ